MKKEDKIKELEKRIEELEKRPIQSPTYQPVFYHYIPQPVEQKCYWCGRPSYQCTGHTIC